MLRREKVRYFVQPRITIITFIITLRYLSLPRGDRQGRVEGAQHKTSCGTCARLAYATHMRNFQTDDPRLFPKGRKARARKEQAHHPGKQTSTTTTRARQPGIPTGAHLLLSHNRTLVAGITSYSYLSGPAICAVSKDFITWWAGSFNHSHCVEEG